MIFLKWHYLFDSLIGGWHTCHSVRVEVKGQKEVANLLLLWAILMSPLQLILINVSLAFNYQDGLQQTTFRERCITPSLQSHFSLSPGACFHQCLPMHSSSWASFFSEGRLLRLATIKTWACHFLMLWRKLGASQRRTCWGRGPMSGARASTQSCSDRHSFQHKQHCTYHGRQLWWLTVW